jgi:2-dehydropantoate 2-reductase
MKFIVLGTGAIGGYVGGRLAAARHDVSFVARPALADLLRTRGLRVTDLDGADLSAPPAALKVVTQVADCEFGPDSVVLLCVKGGATQAAAAELAAVCPPGTPVISLQNGVDNVARIRAAAPALHALAGMVPFNVVSPSPGHWHRATSGELWISSDSPCAYVAIDFRASGMPTLQSADMPAVQWGKLLLNLNNPVNALSDLPLVQQLAPHPAPAQLGLHPSGRAHAAHGRTGPLQHVG